MSSSCPRARSRPRCSASRARGRARAAPAPPAPSPPPRRRETARIDGSPFVPGPQPDPAYFDVMAQQARHCTGARTRGLGRRASSPSSWHADRLPDAAARVLDCRVCGAPDGDNLLDTLAGPRLARAAWPSAPELLVVAATDVVPRSASHCTSRLEVRTCSLAERSSCRSARGSADLVSSDRRRARAPRRRRWPRSGTGPAASPQGLLLAHGARLPVALERA